MASIPRMYGRGKFDLSRSCGDGSCIVNGIVQHVIMNE